MNYKENYKILIEKKRYNDSLYFLLNEIKNKISNNPNYNIQGDVGIQIDMKYFNCISSEELNKNNFDKYMVWYCFNLPNIIYSEIFDTLILHLKMINDYHKINKTKNEKILIIISDDEDIKYIKPKKELIIINDDDVDDDN